MHQVKFYVYLILGEIVVGVLKGGAKRETGVRLIMRHIMMYTLFCFIQIFFGIHYIPMRSFYYHQLLN